jgi:alcohol dehydrogenase (cytochrome c)
MRASAVRPWRCAAFVLPLFPTLIGCGGKGLDAARRKAVAAVDPGAIAAAAASGRDWLTYGRDYANRRYSPLRTIDTSTVQRLGLHLSFHTGAGHVGSFQASPVVVDGVMFVTTPEDAVIAYDLRRRRIAWSYRPRLGTRLLCCGTANRGVAIGDGLVFIGTLDARLIALDAATGASRWEAQVDDPGAGYGITMAPLVVDSLVIVGMSGAEFGIRGHVSAYEARSGRLAWRFYTVPSPDEGGWWGPWRTTVSGGGALPRDLRREHADSARFADAWRRGGGSVWVTPAYDPATGTIYASVGNPAPSFNGTPRPGDNLYTNSIVALEAKSGRLRWYHQLVPHDLWDYDPACSPVLVEIGGRPVVLSAGKLGWLYALDAGNGGLVVRSAEFVPHENLFAPPTAAGVRVAPGADGGSNWSPLSYSPATGLAYVVALHNPMIIVSDSAPYTRGEPWYGGATSLPGPRWGTISGIDPATGRVVWQVRTRKPMVGGSLVTAGGVLFAGEGDGWFRAYDARNGRQLWEFRTPAGVNAPPITFEVDGVQFVAVAAGGNTQQGYPLGDEVFVFSLKPETQAKER